MKKILFSMIVLFTSVVAFTSCNVMTDEPAGGTAVESLAGHWVVTVDVLDDAGNVLAENAVGARSMQTFNTADNDKDQMWMSFLGDQFKISTNVSQGTFECKDVYVYSDEDEDGNEYDVFVTITDGRVIKNGGKNIHDKPVDAIDFNVIYSDDPESIYHVHGIRYQGFTE
ncbi:MAG: hypothetical protein IJ775_05535 [Muribaculaceae bacterium]|nr:hypothetical protein [Muribaculaceae bacterium]